MMSQKKDDFGSDTNEVYVIDKEGKTIHIPLKPKKDIANELIEIVCKKLNLY